jgi:hypothetical protein
MKEQKSRAATFALGVTLGQSHHKSYRIGYRTRSFQTANELLESKTSRLGRRVIGFTGALAEKAKKYDSYIARA